MNVGDHVRYVGPAAGFKGVRRIVAVLSSGMVEVERDAEEDTVWGRTPTGKVSKSKAKAATRSCCYPVWALELNSKAPPGDPDGAC